MTIYTLAVWLIFGSVTAYLAQRRGKNPYLWFFVGMLLGILGLFILFFMPKFQRKAVQKDPTPTVDVLPEPVKEKFWYYLDPTDVQFGPMSFDGLRKAYQEGKVSSETYVWNEDLEDWKLFKEFLPGETLITEPLQKS